MDRTLQIVLVVFLVLLLLALLPAWPYSSGWGWYPSGGVGLLLIILLLVVLLTGARGPRSLP